MSSVIQESRISRFSARSSSSMAELFERNIGGTGKNKSKRKYCKKAPDTMLSRTNAVVCKVHYVRQEVESNMMGYFVRDSTLTMDILTLPFDWRVTRTHLHFASLRTHLIHKYPQTLIPQLPRYDYAKVLSKEQLAKRAAYYERFLTCVMRSMTLRSCELVVDFLREKNLQFFEGKVLATKEETVPHAIDELNTLVGEVDIESAVQSKLFCDGLPDMIQAQKEIATLVSQKLKRIQARSKEQAEDFFAITAELQRLQQIVKDKELSHPLSQLYGQLSDLMRRQGDFASWSAEVLNTELSGWFKYVREQSGSLKEAMHLREEAIKKYDRELESLNRQKENLLRNYGPEHWGVSADLEKEIASLKTDTQRAYSYMLPYETREVEKLLHEAEFFTNQMCREIKRVYAQDYELLRSTTLTLGEMMQRFVYQVDKGWRGLTQYYTNLNEQRRQEDEKSLLAQANYIIEEGDEGASIMGKEDMLEQLKQEEEEQQQHVLIDIDKIDEKDGKSQKQKNRLTMVGQGELGERLLEKELLA
ncbi:hypothetical protein FGO68_gene4893 [Halteria grandinella]|uniref:PX domain-containing protein n=1 Tax=Halteria grandinella TaxID=5974 RepID=A0A8J8P0Q0_HALGN|nr:hypothetical protein FGO68_gene4893 [Halteria grandinella]